MAWIAQNRAVDDRTEFEVLFQQLLVRCAYDLLGHIFIGQRFFVGDDD